MSSQISAAKRVNSAEQANLAHLAKLFSQWKSLFSCQSFLNWFCFFSFLSAWRYRLFSLPCRFQILIRYRSYFSYAPSHLWKRVCPSFRLFVHPSIRKSVTPVQKCLPVASNGKNWVLFCQNKWKHRTDTTSYVPFGVHWILRFKKFPSINNLEAICSCCRWIHSIAVVVLVIVVLVIAMVVVVVVERATGPGEHYWCWIGRHNSISKQGRILGVRCA